MTGFNGRSLFGIFVLRVCFPLPPTCIFNMGKVLFWGKARQWISFAWLSVGVNAEALSRQGKPGKSGRFRRKNTLV